MSDPNILDQLDGLWPKIVAIMLCKLERAGKIQPGEAITITQEDILAVEGYPRRNLATDGKGTQLSVRLVDDAEMSRMLYQAAQTHRSFKVIPPGGKK
jgi:hypothetical protein